MERGAGRKWPTHEQKLTSLCCIGHSGTQPECACSSSVSTITLKHGVLLEQGISPFAFHEEGEKEIGGIALHYLTQSHMHMHMHIHLHIHSQRIYLRPDQIRKNIHPVCPSYTIRPRLHSTHADTHRPLNASSSTLTKPHARIRTNSVSCPHYYSPFLLRPSALGLGNLCVATS